MRILAIETASEACSVALFEGDRLVAHDHRILGRGHAELLVPMIAGLPDKGRAERILVSLGPGSFTGVRIGIATARALGFAWGAEVLGYPTLALVAVQAKQPAPVTVCMNGGHGEWFVQSYSGDKASSELRSLKPEQAAKSTVHPMIAGNRATELAELLSEEHLAVAAVPDARNAILLEQLRLKAELKPIYGRQPDAVPQAERPLKGAQTP